MKKDKVYEKSVLKEMKKDYAEFQKKYNLPSFEKLNEYFSIEKVADYETDFLLREIRKHVADRLQNYMRFIKESYKLWEKIKNETLDILKVVEKNWDSKMEFNGRSYFS